MEIRARARAWAGWARTWRWCLRAQGRGGQGAGRLRSNDGAQRTGPAAAGRVPTIPAKMKRGGARCAILIASQMLEIEPTCSQQTRKLFLIASFSGLLACRCKFAKPAKRDRRSHRRAARGAQSTNHNPQVTKSLLTNHHSQIPIHSSRITRHSSLLHCPPLPTLLK